MSRLLRMEFLLIASVLFIGGLIGLLNAAEEPAHRTISDGLEPLRAAFNADPENVRAILLASPT